MLSCFLPLTSERILLFFLLSILCFLGFYLLFFFFLPIFICFLSLTIIQFGLKRLIYFLFLFFLNTSPYFRIYPFLYSSLLPKLELFTLTFLSLPAWKYCYGDAFQGRLFYLFIYFSLYNPQWATMASEISLCRSSNTNAQYLFWLWNWRWEVSTVCQV